MERKELFIVSLLFGVIIVLIVALIFIPRAGNDEDEAPRNDFEIEAEFETKIVYTTNADAPIDALRADCALRGGSFNECGTICGPDAEMCPSVCAFTCEFGGGEFGKEAVLEEQYSESHDLIRVTEPAADGAIRSPLTVRGEARGMWYFEASFPITIVTLDGLVVAEGYATAQTDWMTEDFVPFEGTLEFENPFDATQPDFMQRGFIIFKKDNPTGLPEHDDAFELPILFSDQ